MAEQQKYPETARLRRQIDGMLARKGKRYPHLEEHLRSASQQALLDFIRMLRDFEFNETMLKRARHGRYL